MQTTNLMVGYKVPWYQAIIICARLEVKVLPSDSENGSMNWIKLKHNCLTGGEVENEYISTNDGISLQPEMFKNKQEVNTWLENVSGLILDEILLVWIKRLFE